MQEQGQQISAHKVSNQALPPTNWRMSWLPCRPSAYGGFIPVER